jgi:RNA polymerase sigma factor (sigma-70 family)
MQDSAKAENSVKAESADDRASLPRLTDAQFHAELAKAIPHLRAFARSLCGSRDRADDLAQETLAKAWAARDRFAAGTSFQAWTFTILRRTYLAEVRRERFVGTYDELEAERRLQTTGGQEGRVEATDVLRALALLPAAQREALVLFSIGHVSYEQMAEICGVPVGTIKSRIARARAALSARIDGGVMPDARHGFVLKGEVLDAFLGMLRQVAPPEVLARLSAA